MLDDVDPFDRGARLSGPEALAPGEPPPGCLERLTRFLTGGVPASGERGWLDVLLPVPIRVLVVLAGAVIGWAWDDANVTQQLAWGLNYAALIAVSLGVSFWFLFLLLQLAVSGPWLLLEVMRPRKSSALHCLDHLLTFVNRQLGHLEALGVWLAVALVWRPQPDLQLPFALAVLLLGEPLLNFLGRRFAKRPGDGTK